MIEIDGSYGEGGGQILRTSLALSILTKKPFIIRNIRANRPNPGLRPQHLAAIKVLQGLSNANVEGASVGSSEISFYPGDIEAGKYKFDMGTAGSITLVLQAILPTAFLTSSKISLSLRGGTDVKWSPSWDDFDKVFLHVLSTLGIKVKTELIKRGFYPAGGGEVTVEIFPSESLDSIRVDEPLRYENVEGNIVISKLPDDIPKRIKHSIVKQMVHYSINGEINIEKCDTLSPGVIVTLWADSNYSRIGCAILGEKGLPSEILGRKCALNIIDDIKSGVTLDMYATDQILPYIAYITSYRGEKSVLLSRELTRHAKTNAWLIEKFLPVKFLIERKEGLVRLEVRQA
ncbi:MAG TPA: RNA 3'-terminal phosphate cyclase [Thermoplasmatales archaeon]|nr:RNA 3'-terminal phosphate cyclase [Thermoplasmatales archaeon]